MRCFARSARLARPGLSALSLLLALAVLAVVAAPAQARVYSVIPADDSGPNDAFLTNEILYAMGTNNALEGASELCVVPAGSGDQGDCAEDAAWGRPNAIAVQGTFPPQPIEGALLPPGAWQILADNGDEDTDVTSAQFTVSPCAPGDECPTTIADAVMAEWKQAAAAARTGTGFACVNSSTFRSGGAVAAGSALLGSQERSEIMAEIKGDGVSVGFRRGSSIEKSVSLLRSVSCGAFVMYDDIVADPPDPNFENLVEPEPASVDTSLTTDPSVVAAVQRLHETTVYGNAHRAGVERYQGALLAGDEGWAAAHATRVGEQALATQLQMRRLGSRLRAAALAIVDPDLEAGTSDELTAARAIRERIRISGFTAEETTELQAEGLTEGEIAEARRQLGAPLPAGVTPMTPAAALSAAADQIDTATCIDETDLCGFDHLGRVASAAGANGAIPPTISVSPLELRESDVGRNHGRVRIELSHPSPTPLSGGLEVQPLSTAPDEVTIPANGWYLEAGRTQTYRSVTVDNDTQVEADETAGLVASSSDLTLVSSPATVTVLDDDGPGDPPSRARFERGALAMLVGENVYFTEPDATELTSVFGGQFLQSKWIPAWSADGRWLLAQHSAPTLSALEQTGEPIYSMRVTGDGTISGDSTPLVVEGKPYPAYPAFSRDGRRLVMSQYRDALYKLAVLPFDPASGTAAGPVHVTGDDPPLDGWWTGHGATFNPDRSRIAFAGCTPGFAECGIYVVPVSDSGAATGPPVAVRTAPPNRLYFPAWSPNGKLIAYQEHDYEGNALLLKTVRVGAAGQPLGAGRTALEGDLYSTVGYPAWAPDSASLAYGAPTDPMLLPNEGGAVFVIDLDAEGGAVGSPRQVGLTSWSALPLWGTPPDDAPPVTTATVSPAPDGGGVHRSAVTVSLKATDNRRVAEIEYSVDGASKTVDGDEASFPLSGEGGHTVRFRARDTSGNTESENERVVRIEAPVPTPEATPTPTAQTPSPKPAAPSPTPAAAVAPATLPPNRRCVSRRKFVIRLRQAKDDPLKRAEVFLGKKRVRLVTGKRLTATIDLRNLPKGRVTVRVVGTTRSGQKVVSQRAYRTCAPKRR